MDLNEKKVKNLMKINNLNKKKKNLDSKNFIDLLLFYLFFQYRRSALAQRQREEEQLKGKLTAEELRRQVRVTKKLLNLY